MVCACEDLFCSSKDNKLVQSKTLKNVKCRWASYLETLLLLRATFIFFLIDNVLLISSLILHLVSGQYSSEAPILEIFLHLPQLASCAYLYLYTEELFR